MSPLFIECIKICEISHPRAKSTEIQRSWDLLIKTMTKMIELQQEIIHEYLL